MGQIILGFAMVLTGFFLWQTGLFLIKTESESQYLSGNKKRQANGNLFKITSVVFFSGGLLLSFNENVFFGIFILILLIAFFIINKINKYNLEYKRIFMSYRTVLKINSNLTFRDKLGETATVYFSSVNTDFSTKASMINAVISSLKDKELIDKKKTFIGFAHQLVTTHEMYINNQFQNYTIEHTMKLEDKKDKALKKALKKYPINF